MAEKVERFSSEQYTIHDFDIGDLTLSTTTLGPLKSTNGHSHPWKEAYYVSYGFGYMEVGERVVEFSIGDFIEVGSDEFHRVFNCSDFHLTFICAWRNNA